MSEGGGPAAVVDHTRIVKMLAATPLFGVLDDPELDAVASAARARSFRRGQFAFFEGDEATAVVVLLEGRLKLVISSATGNELLLDVVEPGSILGEIGVVDGGPRSATLEVLADSTAIFVPAAEVRRLLRLDERFREAMMLRLATMVRRLTGTTADLVFLDLPRRAAKLLAASSGRPGDPDPIQGLSQSDLGSRLGASRQSVNVALRTFERRGWVELSRQQVTVLDAVALERFAGSA